MRMNRSSTSAIALLGAVKLAEHRMPHRFSEGSYSVDADAGTLTVEGATYDVLAFVERVDKKDDENVFLLVDADGVPAVVTATMCPGTMAFYVRLDAPADRDDVWCFAKTYREEMGDGPLSDALDLIVQEVEQASAPAVRAA